VGKPIPKKIFVSRDISLNHLVSNVIPAFESYGDLFQLILPPLPHKIFCLRNPNHIKAVTSHEECGAIKPAHTIPKADYFMGDGVYNDLGGETWKAKRRVLNPAFTEASSRRLSEDLPYSLEKMKARWKKHGTTSPLELYGELQRMVLDYGAYALFSRRLTDEELDWIVEATGFAEMMFVTLTPLWIPTPSNMKLWRIKTRFHAFMDDVIRERRKTAEPRPDMLHTLLNTPNPVTGKPHTDEEIKAQLFSAYFGTPAVTLTILWGAFFLSTRPEILEKVRTELKGAAGGRVVRAEDLSQLPYLDMFIKEVLRTYPSFWGSLRYAEHPIEFDGYQFPAKSIFAMIRFAAQRHPAHWENPDQFIPERHEKRNACPHALLPFGLGPRLCLGRNLASIMAPMAVAFIAQNFDIQMQSDKLELKYGFGIYPAHDMMATVHPLKWPTPLEGLDFPSKTLDDAEHHSVF